MKKNNNETEMDSNVYAKRLKNIGIFGMIFSICLLIFDIYSFKKGWYSIISLIIDGVLLIFSVYFIVKSINFLKQETKKEK